MSSLTWSGVLVTPGTVRVHVTIAGNAATAEQKIAVTARPEWAGLQMRDTMTYGTSDSDMHADLPDSLPDLGHVHQKFLTRLTLDSSFAVVKDGPNQDLGYLIAMPYLVSDSIHVNEPALEPTSGFTSRQAAGFDHPLPKPDGPWCTPASVAEFLPKIKRHEGVTFDPDSSHAGMLRRLLAAAQPTTILEGFVAHVSASSPTRAMSLRLDSFFAATMSDVLHRADDMVKGGDVPAIKASCNLNFFHN